MAVTFNLNDQVRIQVTDRGRQVFDAYYRNLGLNPAVYYKPEADGRIVMQLWEMAHIFGPALFMGPPTPVEMTVEFA